MKILVTGGAGFIGSNFILHMLQSDPDCEILNFDSLTYAGNLDNLKAVESNPSRRSAFPAWSIVMSFGICASAAWSSSSPKLDVLLWCALGSVE